MTSTAETTMSRARSSAVVLLVIFVAGGIGGTLLDKIHVRWHVLHYAHPALLGQAWWVAPQFGVAVVLGFWGVAEIVKRRPGGDARLVVDALAFVVAYLITGLFHRESWLVLSLLLGMWVALLSLHRERRTLLIVSIALAIVGPTYESALTATGAFRYDVTPLVMRAPVWLPALYLIAGVMATSVVRSIAQAER